MPTPPVKPPCPVKRGGKGGNGTSRIAALGRENSEPSANSPSPNRREHSDQSPNSPKRASRKHALDIAPGIADDLGVDDNADGSKFNKAFSKLLGDFHLHVLAEHEKKVRSLEAENMDLRKRLDSAQQTGQPQDAARKDACEETAQTQDVEWRDACEVVGFGKTMIKTTNKATRETVFAYDSARRRSRGQVIAELSAPSATATPSTSWRTLAMGPRRTYRTMASAILKKRDNDVNTWDSVRRKLFRVMESNMYSVVMGLVILLNAILVIHEVDCVASGPGVPGWVGLASGLFLVIYILELVVRFFTVRIKFFQNAWNLLDLMVVMTDLFAELVNAAAGRSDIPLFSVVRIFRLLRLVRLISMLCVFPELQTMLLGFASAMRAMLWASLMICIVVTVCSIFAVIFIHPLNVEVAKTGVYKDCDRCGRAYQTVAESNLTLIQAIIAGDSWGKSTLPIIEAYPPAAAFFLLVFAIIDLGVINLVLMVIVNAAEKAREANKDLKLQEKMKDIEKYRVQLAKICKDIDLDGDGKISIDEFKAAINSHEELCRALAAIDIQKQDAEVVFHIMDQDDSGDVDVNEFIGTLVETSMESLATKHLFLKASIQQIHKELTSLGSVLEEDVAAVVKTVHDESSSNLSEIAKTLYDDVPSKTRNEIMKVCRSLEQKIDQRLEHLQAVAAQLVFSWGLQTDDMQRLDQRQAEAQSYTKLPNLCLPSAGAQGHVEHPHGRRWRNLCSEAVLLHAQTPTSA